ncbi:MAG TPA: hypothetical protein VLW26_08520 [Steroidobacteraceae bacterium]|nr:hypothetical protein [Steroidobacteraceae bacterium]
MFVCIDASGRLIHDQERGLVLTCPHCEVAAHITPSAVPSFEELQVDKPQSIGVVYRCDACHQPIFLRFPVRMYRSNRIELSPQFIEVERAREKFSFTHVPESVEVLFREALTCYSANAFNAFASMCRRTAQATFSDLGESGKLRLFDELNAIRDMAGLDGRVYFTVKSVIFGASGDPRSEPAMLDQNGAAVVLEVMKDLLYEAYIRKGRLQKALMMRRFLADETADNLQPLPQVGSHAADTF